MTPEPAPVPSEPGPPLRSGCEACRFFEKKYDGKPAAIRWYSLHHAEILTLKHRVESLEATDARLTAERDEAMETLKLVLGAHGDYREGMDHNRLCGCYSCLQGESFLKRMKARAEEARR